MFVYRRLESPLKSYEDCELLSLNLAGVFMGVVQYNNDSRGNVCVSDHTWLSFNCSVHSSSLRESMT